MCLIAYKPQNVKIPDSEMLATCFDNNPHGAGYMFAHGGKVHIVKGLMTYKALLNSLLKTVSQYGQYLPYVFHFRWSTQAGIRKDCTHPFPLSKKMGDLRKLRCDCDFGIAHNGVINLTSSYAKNVTYNDTMRFVTDYLSLIIKRRDYYLDKDIVRLIDRLTESKLAILDGNGHCELTGDGWITDNGMFYSNNDYLDWRKNDFESYLGEQDICPLFEYGDESFCESCQNYDACYFSPRLETTPEKLTYSPKVHTYWSKRE